MSRSGIPFIAVAVSALLCPAEAQKLAGTGAIGNSAQGTAVAISGDGSTVLVGGPSDNGGAGAAWVYTLSNGVWMQQAKLLGSNAVGNAAQGTSVALSADGNTALVGGPAGNSNIGAVWVFTRAAGVWNQQARLTGMDAIPTSGAVNQGCSVSLSSDGNTALVGGRKDNSAAGGAAWVYTRANGNWTQQGPKLVGSGYVRGTVFYGPANLPVDQGASVALSADGNTAVIGGPYDNALSGGFALPSGGAIWVFTRTGGVWSQQGPKLVGSGNITEFTYQGSAVAVSADGNTLIAVGTNTYGSAWVFTRTNNTWTQHGFALVLTDIRTGFYAEDNAVALSADGNTALIGGEGDNNNVGAAFAFNQSNGEFLQTSGKIVAPGVLGQPQQGASVALSADGKTAVLGGPGDDGGAGAAWIVTPQATVGLPAPVAVNPASGTSSGETFVFTFTSYQNLSVANILMNDFLDGRSACYLAYSAVFNLLYLVADDGATLLPGQSMAAAGTTSNSQCTVSWTNAPFTGDGNTLTLTLTISFNASFGGNKVIYQAAVSTGSHTSGWQTLGVIQVPGAAQTTTTVVNGMSPARGKGLQGANFTFNFSDTKGSQDLGVMNILINNFLDGRHACYLAYSRPHNTLYLVNDTGDALLPGQSLDLGLSLSNGQCSVSWAGNPFPAAGSLSLTLNIAFTSTFLGNRVIYLAARDVNEANNTGWQASGTWNVQ